VKHVKHQEEVQIAGNVFTMQRATPYQLATLASRITPPSLIGYALERAIGTHLP
jgi:hypothetical protein